MKILLSNDDGVHALGIHVMYEALKRFGDVWIVAPLEEKSTTGHSLTIHKPLRLTQMGKRFFGVNGSPADCVYIGIRQVIGVKPDIVVSGINRGANLGQDVYYSGTVSAAREACILGIPSLAVSLAINFRNPPPERKLHYASAASIAAKVLKNHMLGGKLPERTLLNLNCPNLAVGKVKGVRFTRQGFRYYSGNILKRRDHRGKDYFWVGGQYQGFHEVPGTDCFEVDRGFASLTPLSLDCTDSRYLSVLSKDGFEMKRERNKRA